MVRISICGDIFPGGELDYKMSSGDVESLIGPELVDFINSVDFRIANLEAPLTDCDIAIKKNGPALKASQSTIQGLEKMSINLLALANNHIMDFGKKGLEDTINCLVSHSIDYVGVCDSICDVRKAYIHDIKGVKIGVYACAEHEFSIATKCYPGAIPFDPFESNNFIRHLKSKCDYVIVLYHGGKEYYRYPSPRLQTICRSIVKAGADLVVCQHSHCIGCQEQYMEGAIVYGQGNFIFCGEDNEYWNSGMLIEICVSQDINRLSFIPVVCLHDSVRKANLEESNEILKQFMLRSEQIKDEAFISEEYRKFSKENLYKYIIQIVGYSKWERRLDRYLLRNYFYKRKINMNRALMLLNFISCEAHNELLTEGLLDYIYNGENSENVK